jgi:hypothetical protein
MTNHPDFLRSPAKIFDADPRSSGFDVLGNHGLRAKTLEDHYEAVAQIAVHAGVPREVVVKFETAKNLNLFSWFVYRFHSAARSHAYECLELALRIRFKDELYEREERKRREKFENERKRKRDSDDVEPYQPMDKEKFRPMLRQLLEYAIEVGALRNENFTAWQTRTRFNSRHRTDIEAIKKMQAVGLTELAIDGSELEFTAEDRDHDYLAQLLAGLPFLRNHYAHGTSALDDKSLGTLRLVAEIINQIFPETGSKECRFGHLPE